MNIQIENGFKKPFEEADKTPTTYNAILYKAGNSDAHQVQVTITSSHITFILNGERVNYILSEARLEPVYNNVPREVELVGGYKLTFDVNVPIERYFTIPQNRLLISIIKNKKLLLLVLTVVFMLLILLNEY